MNIGIENLLWFGLIGLAFFFMMRGGCGAHVMGHGHGHHHDDQRLPPGADASTQIPSGTATDPVCGMQVDPTSARSCVYRGKPYFFCSAEHREAFEADPGQFVGGSVPKTIDREAHSHG